MNCPEITLVSEEFPPFMFGGIGAVASDLASSLSKRRIPTVIFCGTSKRISIERPNDYLEVIRLPYLDLPPRFFWFQFQNSLKILRSARALRDCRIIHAISPQVAFLCARLKKALKKPLVTTYHGVPFYELRDFVSSPMRFWSSGDLGYSLFEFPLNDMLIRSSLRNSDKMVACSKSMLAELCTFYRKIDLRKALVIHNGVNFDNIGKIESSSKGRESSDGLSIIFVGRLYYLKGITYMIEALRRLLPEHPNLKLDVYGTGPLKEKIQMLIVNRGLTKNIFLHGHIDRTRLMERILKSDIFVLPSLREANPVSIMEAMALRRPVVTFDYAYAREIIRDERTGFLARPRDPENLAAKMEALLSDEKLRKRIGQEAYEYVKKNHSWDVLVGRYVEMYKDLIDNQKCWA